MRCVMCGWVVGKSRCLCGATYPSQGARQVPIGTKVAARPNRGPSVMIWLAGEVVGHEGTIHKVQTHMGIYWVDADDLLPESSERTRDLSPEGRVWALWLDGRWYPGTIEAVQGNLRRVVWDDGDAMWLEVSHIVPMAADAEPPEVGATVVAQRWDGEYQPAQVEQQEGGRYRVVFRDGEESWAKEEDLKTFPPNPFLK